uniref:DNA-binding protein D-ETS-4 n=1 Tax=Syphacia muris TaxID=451379 RepID=A0A158R5L7_9BILA
MGNCLFEGKKKKKKEGIVKGERRKTGRKLGSKTDLLMDTLNGSIIGAESALSAYRWNPFSPSALCEADDDDNFCKRFKTEVQQYELDDNYGYSTLNSAAAIESKTTESSSSNSMQTIPLASCATAAASLSSAFCKRPNAFTKPQAPSVLCERSLSQCHRSGGTEASFPDDMQNNSMMSGIKAEQTENNPNIYNANQNSFVSMSPNDCSSVTGEVLFQNSVAQNAMNSNGVVSSSSVSAAANSSYNDSTQVEIYRELILRQLMQDISTTCTKLGLPTNPYTWTAEHSSRWISDMCMQFQLTPPRQLFLSGRVLLSMTQEEFLDRAPEGGDTLHAQLQLWKTGNYQSVNNDNTTLNRRSQQAFFNGVQEQTMDMLHSPSGSDVSSTGSNDGQATERLPENRISTAPAQFPRHSGTVHLWHFIRELLDQPKEYSSCVRWVDRKEGTFKIESSHHLARFWGQRKNRAQMNYDKLSRSLRQYYKKGIIQKPEKKQRLVYKFLPPYNL